MEWTMLELLVGCGFGYLQITNQHQSYGWRPVLELVE